jgi:hypothetical protein
MSETVVVRGSGGALFVVDVPTSGHALAHWQEKLDKGDIVIVDEPAEVKPAPAAPAVSKRSAKKVDAAKAEAATDSEG